MDSRQIAWRIYRALKKEYYDEVGNGAVDIIKSVLDEHIKIYGEDEVEEVALGEFVVKPVCTCQVTSHSYKNCDVHGRGSAT